MRYYLSDFENYISQNKLQNLPDKSIIWCKTDYLGNLFQELKQYKNKTLSK